MKVLAVLVVAVLVFNCCEAGVLTDTFKKFGESVKTKAVAIGSQLKDVGKALGGVAVDQLKGLASQGIQAVAGAVMESFKGFNLGNILFGIGKRDLSDTLNLNWVEDEAKLLLDAEVEKTYSKLAAVSDALAEYKPTEELGDEIDGIIADHRISVRGIIGDTINTAIDGIRGLWYKAKGLFNKAKDAVFGSKEVETSDPVMIGRRGLLKDMWNNFSSKLQSFKQKIMPHVDKATEVTTNIAAALKHHAGKMLAQAKDKAVTKMRDTLGNLAGDLHQHLKNAKEKFAEMKEQLTQAVKNAMSN